MDDTLLTEMMWDKLLADIEMNELYRHAWDNWDEQDCRFQDVISLEDLQNIIDKRLN